MTFLSEANKLKNIQINLEKSEQILFEHLKRHGETNIIEFHQELEMERKQELNNIQNELLNMINLLHKFKSLTTIEENENLDLKQIKKDIISLSENIKNIKNKTQESIQKLERDEKYFSDDVAAYENKIAEWEKQVNATQSSYKNNNNKFNQNVADFLTFLSKTGGHTNGWSVDDHSLFLKTRAKFKDINDLCMYMHMLLPDITEEEIRSHESWYVKYRELKEKEKEAIKVWRKSKSAALPNKIIKENNKRVTSAYNKLTKINRQDVKEQIERWKQEKLEKQITDKTLKDEMIKSKKENEEKQKQEREQIKKIVQTWRLTKLEKKEIELYEKYILEKKQRLFRSAMANRLIKEFQLQDSVYVERRIESCKPKIESAERVSRTTLAIRDPARLLKPTKQWISRIRSSEGSCKTINNVTTIKGIQRRSVPEWRRNVGR